MKFYLSMSVIAILITGNVSAQHVHIGGQKNINIGIKGGLNVYNINNSNGAKYDSKTGIHLGILAHIHLNKQWAFQPELVYSGQGAKFTDDGDVTKLKLGYINLPLLIQYMFDNGFRIQAGPQVGFMISAKASSGSESADIKDNFKAVDFGIGAGLGYVDVPSGFGVDFRYNLGLSNINESSTVKSTNRGFQLGVFYLFKHS